MILWMLNLIKISYTGTDEKALIGLIVKLSNAQRVEVRKRYKTMFGKVGGINLFCQENPGIIICSHFRCSLLVNTSGMDSLTIRHPVDHYA